MGRINLAQWFFMAGVVYYLIVYILWLMGL